MKLSQSAFQFLRDVRHATRQYPMRTSLLSRSGRSLERKGLVDSRGATEELGPGGWFITPEGKKLLAELESPV